MQLSYLFITYLEAIFDHVYEQIMDMWAIRVMLLISISHMTCNGSFLSHMVQFLSCKFCNL